MEGQFSFDWEVDIILQDDILAPHFPVAFNFFSFFPSLRSDWYLIKRNLKELERNGMSKKG